ncbi:surface-associated interspersed protein (SURFIN), fragment [Plasmodium gallinaceum]|uniref:Surface-associated interspersed protein (SURFIN) n=1 Tax=Plasmodium gallinaceum TaxID=5849 RepID=A0A1J1GQ59_PLAGA|nr:surface-associated interspersed protein (SURFIN), fragment [Plasmodium gallinaceum]CRG94406.1 surface-associated interspersed protein (SURFIN), fragment [Plasmodium gallinaceum]
MKPFINHSLYVQNVTANVTSNNTNNSIYTSTFPLLIAFLVGASLLLIIFLFIIHYKKGNSMNFIITPSDIPYELLESNIQLNNVCNRTNNSLCSIVFENNLSNALTEKSEEKEINIKTKSDIAIIREKLKSRIIIETYIIIIDKCKKE